MRRKLLGLLAGACLAWECCAPLPAQPPTEQEAVPRSRRKLAERQTREGSPAVLGYSIAGIGAILVMILVCMPARRE